MPEPFYTRASQSQNFQRTRKFSRNVVASVQRNSIVCNAQPRYYGLRGSAARNFCLGGLNSRTGGKHHDLAQNQSNRRSVCSRIARKLLVAFVNSHRSPWSAPPKLATPLAMLGLQIAVTNKTIRFIISTHTHPFNGPFPGLPR